MSRSWMDRVEGVICSSSVGRSFVPKLFAWPLVKTWEHMQAEAATGRERFYRKCVLVQGGCECGSLRITQRPIRPKKVKPVHCREVQLLSVSLFLVVLAKPEKTGTVRLLSFRSWDHAAELSRIFTWICLRSMMIHENWVMMWRDSPVLFPDKPSRTRWKMLKAWGECFGAAGRASRHEATAGRSHGVGVQAFSRSQVSAAQYWFKMVQVILNDLLNLLNDNYIIEKLMLSDAFCS